MSPLLDVRGLTLTIGRGGRKVVDGVDLAVGAGEIVGVVGESGSGKTMAARAALGLLPPAVRQAGGTILFEGRDVGGMSPRELRALRGARIGMVFQEPMTSLNPSMTIGRQLEEGLKLHRRLDPAARRDRVVAMLRRVGLADPDGVLTSYPHRFSGGMRQRIMLASVMLLGPALLVADEPTTALDAVVQRDVLELMVELTRERRTAVMLISHDLSMVARYTTRVTVMESGRVVEAGATADILASPGEPYTRRLLAAMPRRATRLAIAPSGRPLVAVKRLVVEYPSRGGAKRVLHGVDLAVEPGEVVAVVGGSGSGKTTLGRAIVGLVRPSAGAVLFRGEPVAGGRGAAWRDYRLAIQMIFQDPYSSLDPRMTVGALVGEALRHSDLPRALRSARIAETLEEVGLPEGLFAGRYPHELSGGQRQRVAIARAVVRRPAFVVADEPVSALDMTVRAQVLELFASLQARHGFASLFISHDLGVVEQVADRIVVMNEGRVIEEGARDDVMDAPREAYTRRLLSAIPTLAPTDGGGVRLRWRFGEPDGEAADLAATARPLAGADVRTGGSRTT